MPTEAIGDRVLDSVRGRTSVLQRELRWQIGGYPPDCTSPQARRAFAAIDQALLGAGWKISTISTPHGGIDAIYTRQLGDGPAWHRQPIADASHPPAAPEASPLAATTGPPTAPEILAAAAECISQRAASRDLPAERSMARTVAAFNAITGRDLSEREGWLFMVALKAARATAGAHNPDDYVDGAAYFALAGERAGREP